MFSAESFSLEKKKSWLDLFCSLLQDKLKYAPGERDLVVMHHIFGILTKNGKEEKLSSTMIAYGDPQGYTAMAKTVGLPTAIAAEMILKGEDKIINFKGQIKEIGVIAPMKPEIYEPMLKKLESQGIRFVEKYNL